MIHGWLGSPKIRIGATMQVVKALLSIVLRVAVPAKKALKAASPFARAERGLVYWTTQLSDSEHMQTML
jgi:hypothetical protein